MVNKPKKPTKTNSNTINSVLTNNKTTAKSKQQIDKEYYQKNREKKKQQRQQKYQQDKETEKAKQKQRYLKKKEQSQLITKQQSAKYYQAEAIKVLISFKEYTELNKEKRKLWTDFNWTMKDCQTSIKDGLADIVAIMKLEQVANKLVRDYWDTAKTEEKQRSKNWNLLEQEQKDRLIRYWGYEKARIENNFLTIAEQLEKQSQSYLKEIELAKFHEERGKIKCPCYQCQESKQIQGKIKEQLFKENKTEKEQCPECQKWVKELAEEAGVCKSCKKKYE